MDHLLNQTSGLRRMVMRKRKLMATSLILIVILFLFEKMTSRKTLKRKKSSSHVENKRPHIIFILADDLGWNDVGYHGANYLRSPNIDALAYSGLVLQNYYADHVCSPSRSSLLTGYYPIHTGMHHNILLFSQPWGLPLNFKLLPEYLKDLGYQSHIVGKWHLGYHRQMYLPTKRGFLSHYGYWKGKEDYFTHGFQGKNGTWGYDFYRDLDIDWGAMNQYSTQLFTNESIELITRHKARYPSDEKPLFLYLSHQAVHTGSRHSVQAPNSTIEMFNNLDEKERLFAATLYELDLSVGKIFQCLHKNKMLQNSIIVFSSDNGASVMEKSGSNWPLRGSKDTVWEGGVKVPALIWSPKLLEKGIRGIYRNLMHITDWLPTLYSAAGGSSDDLPKLDGQDHWPHMSGPSKGLKVPREMIMHNFDKPRNFGAIRVGKYKVMFGFSNHGKYDESYGPSRRINDVSYNVSDVHSSTVSKVLEEIGFPLEEDLWSMRKPLKLNCSSTFNLNPRFDSKCNLTIKRFCLFDIEQDPCEQVDLTPQHPVLTSSIKSILFLFGSTAVAQNNRLKDPMGDPRYYNQTWTTWMDLLEPWNDDDTRRQILSDEAKFAHIRQFHGDIESVIRNEFSLVHQLGLSLGQNVQSL